MSRTYRKVAYGIFRSPKGRMNAKRNNARKRSIPPDSWDDIRFSREMSIGYKAATKMIERGIDPQTVAHKIAKKFKIPKFKAIDIAYEIQGWEDSKKITIEYRKERQDIKGLSLAYHTYDGLSIQVVKDDLDYYRKLLKKRGGYSVMVPRISALWSGF